MYIQAFMKGAAYPRLPSRIRLFAWFHAGRATGLYAGICGTVMEVGISYLYLLRLGSIRYFHLRRKDVGGGGDAHVPPSV